ncbi:MAG: radical SAM protein [Candidatus Aminicenantia bacterium]
MKVFAFTGKEDIAMVYIAKMREGKVVEFVESVQPPLPREKKWVVIVSTLFGCPIGCPMCDAGGYYQGKLSKKEIFAQIDFLVKKRFPNGSIPVNKFKIQFARMGEPSFNLNVLEVLEELPYCYNAPGLMPCISTIAPLGTEKFFERLIEIKKKLYRGRFQLQFSIHTTDEKLRDWLIPVKKWDFAKIARYGKQFYEKDDRKITLNFTLIKGAPVDPKILLKHFNPDKFLIKITPVNPAYQVVKNGLSSYIDPCQEGKYYEVVEKLRSFGYEVIVSIGEVEENYIGSNCGQYVMNHLKGKVHIKDGYAYKVQEYS